MDEKWGCWWLERSRSSSSRTVSVAIQFTGKLSLNQITEQPRGNTTKTQPFDGDDILNTSDTGTWDSGANIGHFPKLSWRWCDGILWIEKRVKLSIRGVSCSNIEKSNANFNQSSFKLLELLWTNEDIEDHRSLLHSIWEVTQMFNLDI